MGSLHIEKKDIVRREEKLKKLKKYARGTLRKKILVTRRIIFCLLMLYVSEREKKLRELFC